MTEADDITLRVAEALASPDRPRFLALLAFELSIASRTSYPSASGHDAETVVNDLCAVNEALHVVASQLVADSSRETAYPDAVFGTSVLSQSQLYASDAQIRDAMSRALTGLSQ